MQEGQASLEREAAPSQEGTERMRRSSVSERDSAADAAMLERWA
jgi:hypothetical protein